tara:strand:- start:2310 stop:2579 length:270 start_codon:yes stop_codon:yes gene_type:complete
MPYESLCVGMPVRKFFVGFGAIDPGAAFVTGVVTAREGHEWRVLWQSGTVERHPHASLVPLLACEPRNWANFCFLAFLAGPQPGRGVIL